MQLKMSSNRRFIAKEGYKVVAITLLLALFLVIIGDSFFIKASAIAISVAVLYLFRNPERVTPIQYQGDAIVAPCDGRVVLIESYDCAGNIQGECYKLTIEKSFFDVGILRSPINNNQVTESFYRGIQTPADEKRLHLNEQAKVVFVGDDSNKKVVLKHFLHPFSMALSLFHREGEIGMGERYGFMMRGEVQVFVPASCRIAIKRGTEVIAGETVIAYFNN